MVNTKKLKKLADVITNYSIDVQKNDKVLLRGYGFDSYPLIKEIYRECIISGARQVDVRFSHDELSRIFFEESNDDQLVHLDDLDLKVADSYDAMVQIIADENPYELSGVDTDKLHKVQKSRKPLSDILHKKRWLLFYYPNVASATFAKKSLDEWEDFVFDSCLLDWKKEEEKQVRFIKLMREIKTVKILGDETDLEVSIDGQTWLTCSGKQNLPDGEIFTSPIKTGVNGVIRYNVPTHYQSQDFDWVKLTIKDGKVVKEESNNVEELTKILNTDDGSRYFGEFAFGMNNNIQEGTRQILFDEKMGQSLHMALGKCYDEAPNGNDSSNHWDLIFKFPWANAELYFDGVNVYKNGKWIDERFEFLN